MLLAYLRIFVVYTKKENHPLIETEDEADLIYRYCWAAVEALDWLIGLGDDFDIVPIDT